MGGSRTTATAASWGYRLQSTVYNSTLQQGSFSDGLRGTFLVASLTFALLFALFAKWINFAHLPPVLSHHSLLSPHMQTEISGIGLWTLQRGESESKSGGSTEYMCNLLSRKLASWIGLIQTQQTQQLCRL